MMDFSRGYKPNNKMRLEGVGIGLNSNTLVIIKLPVLQIMSRSLFLAMVILTLPSVVSIIRDSSSTIHDSGIESDLIDFEYLPLLFQDLVDQGLLKAGQKGLIVSSGFDDLVYDLQFLNENNIDLVIESDLDLQNSIADGMFDVVFISSFRITKFVDRVLKMGGIVVIQLSNNPSNEFQQNSNYRIVYLRRFDSTAVAMRKTGLVDGLANWQTKRRLCGVTPEAKKVALNGLEGVLLEPPRRTLIKLSNQFKKIKFLPDLLGDSLESYRRRIFIADEKSRVVDWFYENYPARNQYFETYDLEIEMYNTDAERVGKGGSLSNVVPPAIAISDWLMKKNVRKEDYVVMKAEAQVVEDMIKERTICLVDELFLECKNQWQDGGEKSKSRRAYWQCLALYGRVRDEGVAVHQWWG